MAAAAKAQDPQAEDRLHLAEEMEDGGLEGNFRNSIGMQAVTDAASFELLFVFVFVFVRELGERRGGEGVQDGEQENRRKPRR